MNQNIFISCNPYLRRDYTNKTGQQTIYLRITIPKHYTYISTGIKIFPKNWSKNGISANEPDAFEKNKRLKMLIARAQAIIDKYFFENKTLTPEIFKKEFFVPNNINFFEFAMNELEKMRLAPILEKHINIS